VTRRSLWALAMVVSGLASLMSGCASEDTTVGKWKLVESSGGFTGGGRIPFPDMTVEFTEGGGFRMFEGGELVYSASYSTGIDKTIFSTDPLPVIYLSDGLSYAYSFPDNDTLVLSMDAYDGYQDEFRRT
jgi:hypothetical protein